MLSLLISQFVVGSLYAAEGATPITSNVTICARYLALTGSAQSSLEELLALSSEISRDESLEWGDNSTERLAHFDTLVLPFLNGALSRKLTNAQTEKDFFELIDQLSGIGSTFLDRFVKDTSKLFEDFVEDKSFDFIIMEAEIKKRQKELYRGHPIQFLLERIIEKLRLMAKDQKKRQFLENEKSKHTTYSDGFLQWLLWEVDENHERRQQPIGWTSIPTMPVPVEKIDVRLAEGSNLPSEVSSYILTSNNISWSLHPFNTSPNVPFSYSSTAIIQNSLDFHFTASRSMVLRGTTWSFKIPTNHPTQNENDERKTDMRISVIVSLDRSNLVRRVDQNLAKTDQGSNVVVLTDSAAFVDRATGNGFTGRDLSELNNGQYWLPSHALQTMGAEIAGTSSLSEARPFWIQNYLKPLARAKAQLLLRYGLQMNFPHLQNSVIELDANKVPTGRIAIRDLSDTSFVSPIAKIVAGKELEKELTLGDEAKVVTKLTPSLGLNSRRSSLRQTSAGALPSDLSLTPEVHDQLKTAEEERFPYIVSAEIEKLERLEDSFFIEAVKDELKLNHNFSDIEELELYLFSAEGLSRINDYHESNLP